MQAYSDPRRENDPHALPDIEYWYQGIEGKSEEYLTGPGWYYWYCMPGCLPDSEAIGPFGSEAEALDDARLQAGIDDMPVE